MEHKSVKIIGLRVNHKVGILEACNLQFNQDNQIIKVKGEVGAGKTTLQKTLQLSTQGGKALTDKKLYGQIDIETQLLDGDMPVYVGCKSDKTGKLIYVLYTKDNEGNIVKEPIIDGVKATPSKYLETLQTELTWRMNELTSENPTIQKKILLKLYQNKLRKIGVIFDKKNPDYKNTILYKIEVAEAERNLADAMRKTVGGIAEDLKLKGFDINRPETLPVRIDIEKIENELKKIGEDFAVKKANKESEKQTELNELKLKASELKNQCLAHNQSIKSLYDTAKEKYIKKLSIFNSTNQQREGIINQASVYIKGLEELGFTHIDLKIWFEDLPRPINDFKETEPKKPDLIPFDENGKVQINEDSLSFDLVQKIQDVKNQYISVLNEEIIIDDTYYTTQEETLSEKLKQAKEINFTCDAVDSFYEWQEKNNEVVNLKKKYVKLLSQIDTGVEGLKITPIDDELYLTYDGSYDITYFNNPDKESRKLSSYSGTQKPIICLLIQNQLLNQKPKSMRYMYIDDTPTDKKTIELLEKMSENLNLTIFLNMTGDFDKDTLQNGEILIEGGEVFFK